jgi:hydroxymethylpyrimidine/phosphomethylpyrimidine kinase
MRQQSKGRVLIIAGSDSGGGAGVQADIKTVTALGGYAMTAITAITVQNTLGVTDAHPVPPHIIGAQIDAVMSDLGADAWKIGMLGDDDAIGAVLQAAFSLSADIPIVLDPVMIAKGGARLLARNAIQSLRNELLPMAAVVTPNAPEAEALTGLAVQDLHGQKRAAEALVLAGARHALVKGGHLEGPIVHDVLASADGLHVFEHPRIDTRATHGTGCTLASAIAARLAQGATMMQAVEQARVYLVEAILRAPGLGAGHQPLGHAWPCSGRA